jgi:hypothetical protein
LGFNEKLLQFQNGNRLLFDEIYKLVNEPFTNSVVTFYKDETSDFRTTETFSLPNGATPEMYIAYRIRAMRESYARPAKSVRSGYMDEFAMIVEQLRYVGRFVKKPFVFSTWDFSNVVKRLPEIKKHLSVDQFNEFYFALNQLIKINGKVQEAKEIYYDEFDTYSIPALEYALSKADHNYSNKEIVKYVNRAWLTKFIELQQKATGVKRIRTKGRTYYVETRIGDDIDHYIFNSNLNLFGGVDGLSLSAHQRQFYDRLRKAIVDEIEAENRDAFLFDEYGKSMLNKRYFANKLGMEESNFKHTIARLRGKNKQAVRDYVDRITGNKKVVNG